MNSKTRQVTMIAMMIALIIVANLIDKLYSHWLTAVNGPALAICALISISLFAQVFGKFRYAVIGGAAFGLVSFVLSFIFISVFFQNPLISILPRLFIGIIGFGAYKLAQIISRKILAFTEKTKLHFAVPGALGVLTIAGLVLFCIFGASNGWVFFLAIAAFVLGIVLFAGVTLSCIFTKQGRDKALMREQFSLTIGTMFTIIANTALVLSAMYLFQDMIVAANPEIYPDGGPYGALGDVFAAMSVINFIPELIITSIIAPFVILGVRRGLKLNIDGSPKIKKIINDGSDVMVAQAAEENYSK